MATTTAGWCRLQLMDASERPRDVQVDVDRADGLRLTHPAFVHLAAGAHVQWVTIQLPLEQAQALAGQVLPIQNGVAEVNTATMVRAETLSTFLVSR